MNLKLHHFFIIVEPEGEVADLLLSIGMEESFRRDHPGQGTSNRRFVLADSMLEILWVRDVEEAINGPGEKLRFVERSENPDASPFGVILTQREIGSRNIPFDGWRYQPDYFDPPMAFHVGKNSANIAEPLCIYAPFMNAIEGSIENRKSKSLSEIKITTTASLSAVLATVSCADKVSIETGKSHLIEISLDGYRSGESRDFRPALPIVMYW